MFEWTRQVGSTMTLSAGSAVLRERVEVRRPVFQGLQVIVALNSRLQGGVDGRVPFDIAESGAYLVLATGEHEGFDRYEANVLQRYVRVGIDADSAERAGFGMERVARHGGRRLHDGEVVVMHEPLTPAMRATALQILVCPYEGPLRDLYLGAKGMELAAVALSRPLAGAAPRSDGLSARDVERLWQAREWVTLRAFEAVSLADIASAVGINVKKLTSGFRQLFGTSVFEHVQRQRLDEAYRMLSSGGYTVTQVATHVGYAIAHFSTAFRRRFGLSPRDLLR